MCKLIILSVFFLISSKFYCQNNSFESNIVGDSIINISVGQKLFINADLVMGRLVNFKLVDERSTHKLVIELKEVTESGKNQVILRIFNLFDMNVEYSAFMYLVKQNRWVKTSVVPVRAKKEAFEMWPDKISAIRINSLKLR
jgi:hypothetical protein